MDKVIKKFQGTEIRIVRFDKNFWFSPTDISKALRLRYPDHAMMETVIQSEQESTHMVNWDEDRDLLVADHRYIIKLALNAETLVAERFLVWLTDIAYEEAEEIVMRGNENYDPVKDNTNYFTVTQIAKKFGMSAKKLNEILYKQGIQFRSKDQWVLTYKYQDQGYTKVLNYNKDDNSGIVLHTYWTQKGMEFIERILKRLGYKESDQQISFNDLD